MRTAKSGRSGRPSLARVVAALTMAASLVCLTIGMLTAPVAAVGESLTVTPSTGLTDGQNVTVTLTTTAATESTVFIGVTQCGNATSSGTPLTVATSNDCMGAAGLGTSLVTIGATGVGGLGGPVPAGTYTATLKMKKTGIGTNGAQCVPLGQATIPCTVSAATATFAGSYTGPGYHFVATAPISYVGPTTTTQASTTTTQASTTTSTTQGSTTSTTQGSTTSTTQASTTTSTTQGSTTSTTQASTTTSTTQGPTTTTTAPPTTKTFDCNDIPLPSSGLVLSKDRCVSPGETVTVSAPPGTFGSAGSAFVTQCNPDTAIPTDGSGCNIAGLGVGAIGGDGSLAATPIVVKSGLVGSDPLSTCPPTQAQADAGVVNCVIAAAPNGDAKLAVAAQFTIAGQTVELPVDSSGTPVTSTTQPGSGSGTGGGSTSTSAGAGVLGNTTIAATRTATLAYTGLSDNTWFMAGVALALIDIGAVAASFARRRLTT